MPDRTTPAFFDGRLTRRSWLGAIALAGTSKSLGFLADEDSAEIAEIRKAAEASGLKGLRESKTDRYLGIGNAPEKFRRKALDLCEDLAKDFLKHFQDRGFTLKLDGSHLTVVALASAKDFGAFLKKETSAAVGGIYDLDTNRLVIFDNRNPNPADLNRAERANTVALMHEATHQLTYNTGLLDRKGDVPVALSEGLAMYGEVRRPNGQGKVGDKNLGWLPVLVESRRKGEPWFPLSRLLVEDNLLDDADSAHLSRAQSWLLVHYLLQTKSNLPAFRSYLAAIKDRKDSTMRLQDAATHLGDLRKLETEVLGHLQQLIKSR